MNVSVNAEGALTQSIYHSKLVEFTSYDLIIAMLSASGGIFIGISTA